MQPRLLFAPYSTGYARDTYVHRGSRLGTSLHVACTPMAGCDANSAHTSSGAPSKAGCNGCMPINLMFVSCFCACCGWTRSTYFFMILLPRFVLLCSVMAGQLINAASTAIINGNVGPAAIQALLGAIDCSLLLGKKGGLGLGKARTYVRYLAAVWPHFAFPAWLPRLPDDSLVALLEDRVLESLSGSQWEDEDALRSVLQVASSSMGDFARNQAHLMVSYLAGTGSGLVVHLKDSEVAASTF